MLNSLATYTVLPAADLNRARAFYKETFDLEPSIEKPGMLMYTGPGGNSFELYETENGGTAKHTQMGFSTEDLDGTMTELRGRGVQFDDYDFPDLKTENGVASVGTERACWFHDSEGNTICLTQTVA